MQSETVFPTFGGYGEGNKMPSAWTVDMADLVDEEKIRALVYDTVDEELMAVGDKADEMRVNLRMWSRLQQDKVAEIVLRVLNVLTSGRWLSVRTEMATERVAESYYISSKEGVNDIERLLKLMDIEIMNNLPVVAEKHELQVFVKELIAKLGAKLQKLWQTATSVRPLSLIYEKKWVKAWKDDVLSPTTAEISAYEAEIAELLSLDETETRKSALRAALDYVQDTIMLNPWGELYLNCRDDITLLVKSISAKRFNEGGNELDQLRQLARKYEWLEGEIERLKNPFSHASDESQIATAIQQQTAAIHRQTEVLKEVASKPTSITANSVTISTPSLQKQDLNFQNTVGQVVAHADKIETSKEDK